MTLNKLILKIYEYDKKADFELIKKAYLLAKKAHKGQKRMSGEDYIIHPLWTAHHLAELKSTSTMIAAGLLHDVAEDTEIPIEVIKKEFGEEIAFLVEGVSKLGKIKYHGVEREVENLRKLFLAMAEDIRVIIIKFCDRLHNLETLQYLPKNKQKRIALEALEIYSPIAHRLGIGEIKGKMEDIAFSFAYPKEYQGLIERVKDKYEEREEYLKKIKPLLEKGTKKEKIELIKIHSRAKHYWSLYQKLKQYDNDLSKIYDLVALRIIVRDVEDCYKTIGLIHGFWRPLPGRIKDYIALPKLNGYQSLHTTIFCEDGKIVELQVRTEKMHNEAEFGIAAHWRYSETKGSKNFIKQKTIKNSKNNLKWVAQFKKWQEENEKIEPNRYLESIKTDFFNKRIFIFTPKGSVIDLPENACAIDFAYAVHTEIGNRCKEAKINGKISMLSKSLKNGDIVEIITAKLKKPSRDWLNIVKTNLARSQIKKQLKNKLDSEKEIIQKEKVAKITKKILPKPVSKKKPLMPKKVSVILAGEKGISTKLAKCCSPQKDDAIKAYITKNTGATIHKIGCKNLERLEKKWPQRIINASWPSH
ncbi:MAG: RelA/SpoT family protein [Patescibacteria group bacterium]|nr:RelA/SpoT family protein [Patescibacteria group bacterium]